MSGVRVRWAVLELRPGRFMVIPFEGTTPSGALDVLPFEQEARSACRLRESTFRIQQEREGRTEAPIASQGGLFE